MKYIGQVWEEYMPEMQHSWQTVCSSNDLSRVDRYLRKVFPSLYALDRVRICIEEKPNAYLDSINKG